MAPQSSLTVAALVALGVECKEAEAFRRAAGRALPKLREKPLAATKAFVIGLLEKPTERQGTDITGEKR